MKHIQLFEEFVNEAAETSINQLAKDEQSEGYDAKVFLGKFDGRIFKAQSTDKTWQDGVPVMKNFSRNGFKDVNLKGEYQLCLLYTSPSPRDRQKSRMPSSA